MTTRHLTTRIVDKRRQAGFTFAEALAAMVFMAILIPVVIQGLSLSNRAAVIAERKTIATRLANNVLTDSVITGSWKLSNPSGDFEEPWYEGYRWEIHNDPWEQGKMTRLSVEVFYQVQGREYSVILSTLIDETQQE